MTNHTLVDPIDIFEDEDLSRAREILATGNASGEMSVNLDANSGEEDADADLPKDEREASLVAMDMAAVEPTDAHVKIRVRRTTRSQFDVFKAELSTALGGARLMDSNVGRAVLDWFLFEVGDQVLEAARDRTDVLRRPASDDLVGMAAFDDELRAIIARAVQRERDNEAPFPE